MDSTPNEKIEKTPSYYSFKERLLLKLSSKKFTIFSFLTPSLLIIMLFVYIPLLFALIVSLYVNPTPFIISEHLLSYYTDTYWLNWIKLRDLFRDLWVQKFFVVFGAVGIPLGSVWGVKIAKKLGLERESHAVFSSIFFNILVSPFIIFGSGIILMRLPWWAKLPLKNYDDVLTNQLVLDNFLRILFNTVFWTVTCTFFHIVLGIGLAVLMNQEFKGRGPLRTLFILPWAIPSFISALMWKNYIFNPERGILGKWAAENIKPGSAFYFTIADLLATILIFGAFLLFFSYARKRASSGISVIMGLIGFLVSIFLIDLIIQANTLLIPVLGTPIFSITNTKTSFWFTSDFYFFNIKMKTIEIAAILTNIWLGVPFMMVSFLAALQAIPDDLYEAAEIDGASAWTKFSSITFPLIKPTLRTVALLGIIWTFNLFNVFYILAQNQTGIGSRTYYDIFITYIYYLFQQGIGGTPHYAYAASLSFIVFLLLVGFSKVYQSLFREEDGLANR